MQEIQLDVQVRKHIGKNKVNKLKNQDAIPGVIYGKDHSPTPVQVNRRLYERIMRSHKGHNVIFHLNLSEGDKKLGDYPAIVRDEQLDPVVDRLLHIDFMKISLTTAIDVKVAILVVGEAEGVKKGGGSLDQPLRELDVHCLPTQIPENIKVDVTNLKIHDAIHVRDLILPPEVKTKHDPSAIVVSVVAAMKEEVAVPTEEAAKEPELIKKEKAAKEEGAGEEKGAAEKKPEKAEKKPEAKK